MLQVNVTISVDVRNRHQLRHPEPGTQACAATCSRQGAQCVAGCGRGCVLPSQHDLAISMAWKRKELFVHVNSKLEKMNVYAHDVRLMHTLLVESH